MLTLSDQPKSYDYGPYLFFAVGGYITTPSSADTTARVQCATPN